MKALADSLPEGMRKEHRDSVEEIIPLVLETVRPGDVVMVKSSNGVGFFRLVDALVRHYPATGPER
jgi:UDP-N-acetylmuramoyl-tripeptide--D-alanyl-D-alanine ligase